MRELAERLRRIRLDRGLTVESVADSLLVSASKISRLETAQRRASVRDVRDLCRLYEVHQAERDDLMALAALALEKSWYKDLDAASSSFQTFIGLEEAAAEMDALHSNIIPGLFQTPEYATAVISGLRPSWKHTPTRIHAIVEARARRQQILDRDVPPVVRSIIDETAFRRPVTSPRLMRQQIEKIADISLRPNITVQLIPADVGAHPGLDGRFIALRFPDATIGATVYVEGLVGELFLEKSSDVQRYQEIFDYVATEVALDTEASMRRLQEIGAAWQVRA